MEILIINSSSQRCPRSFLIWWIEQCHRHLAREGASGWNGESLCLQFLEPREMAKINRTYRGKAKPTDVLSFNLREPGVLGELALCPDVISKQAQDHGLPYWQELGYVVLHGILHLMGYEHEGSERRAREMFALQDRLFEQLCLKWERRPR